MNTDRVHALLLGGALFTTPFLFGAQGNGCQAPTSVDAGVDGAAPSGRGSDACVDNVLCIRGDHWDPSVCRCVSVATETDASADAEGKPEGGEVAPGSGSDACVDNVLCIRGDHWDVAACKCVPDATDASTPNDAEGALDAARDACVDNVLCIQGDHWDPLACKCVSGCRSASDCHGALPQLCVAECEGGAGACAHFVCRQGMCETVICE